MSSFPKAQATGPRTQALRDQCRLCSKHFCLKCFGVTIISNGSNAEWENDNVRIPSPRSLDTILEWTRTYQDAPGRFPSGFSLVNAKKACATMLATYAKMSAAQHVDASSHTRRP